jgi:hypothetical protein
MHFQTGKVRLNIQDNAEFLSHYRPDQVEYRDSTAIDLTPATLPPPTRVVVLKHAR